MYTVCIICTDVMTPETELYATRCGHMFHQGCLTRWINTSRTCPQCRNAVTLSCMFRIYPAAANDGDDELVLAQQKKLDERNEKLRNYEAELNRIEKMLKIKEECIQRKSVIEEPGNQQANGRETSANGQPNTSSTSTTNVNINGNSSRAESLLKRTEPYLKMPEDLKIELERALNAAQQRDVLRKMSNINLN